MALSFTGRLLQQADIPLTKRQFWRYASGFYGLMLLINCCDMYGVALLTPGRPLPGYTEVLYWLLTYLLWWAFTPLILAAAVRFPLPRISQPRAWAMFLGGHLLVASALRLVVCGLCYVVGRPLYAHETGHWLGPEYLLQAFLSTYTITIVTYLLLVVAGSLAIGMHRYQRLQHQAHAAELRTAQLTSQLTTARLQSLQMQLNPHFLCNTHHAIVGLMMQHDTDKAIDMVLGLSDLLRGVLAHQHSPLIALREELALTRQYLDIQQVRFQDRLQIEYAVDPAVESCPVPPLLLQPLVENALTHGLAGRAAAGLLRITAAPLPGGWQLVIFDNGRGRSAPGGTGLGLRNARARLAQAYGPAAHFDFAQQPGHGTTVTLRFPDAPAVMSSFAPDYASRPHH
jgi:sensor histidine kinase YesM